MDIADVKAHLKIHFEEVFHASLTAMELAAAAVLTVV
jgi:hypothetical protein